MADKSETQAKVAGRKAAVSFALRQVMTGHSTHLDSNVTSAVYYLEEWIDAKIAAAMEAPDCDCGEPAEGELAARAAAEAAGKSLWYSNVEPGAGKVAWHGGSGPTERRLRDLYIEAARLGGVMQYRGGHACRFKIDFGDERVVDYVLNLDVLALGNGTRGILYILNEARKHYASPTPAYTERDVEMFARGLHCQDYFRGNAKQVWSALTETERSDVKTTARRALGMPPPWGASVMPVGPKCSLCVDMSMCSGACLVDGETTSIPHSVEVAGYTFINPPYGAEAVLMEGNRKVLTATGATAIHALAAIVSLAIQGEASQGAVDELRTSLRGLLGL